MIDWSYTPLSIEVGQVPQDRRFYHAFQSSCFSYDPKLIWRPRSGHSLFNSQGFRGRELAGEKKEGEFRIFAIGDSNTLGWAGEGGANWPGYLGELLATSNENVRVVNAGVWGYSSFQGLARFEETLAFQPDLVLISFGSNDAHRVAVADAEFSLAAYDSPLFNVRLVQLAVAARDRLILGLRKWKHPAPVFRVGLQEYKENLNEIIRRSKEKGIQCVLLTRPYTGESSDEMWWKHYAPDYRAATIEVANRNGVPLVDVYSHFKDKDAEEYFADESHFTEAGHRLAAQIIGAEMKGLSHQPTAPGR